MKLGIIGAMQMEVETLQGRIKNQNCITKAGSTFFEGILSGLPVVIVQCGVGKVNAAICTQILCDCFNVTHIINTGIAGSLCPELDIGDLVVSREAMYHDFDCSIFGYAKGQVPGMQSPQFAADKKMITLAFEAAQSVHPGHVRIGRITSGDQFICDQTQKNNIVSLTQALCTEMEGAAIAHTAQRNGIPCVILRAISDKADHSAEIDYPVFEKNAARQCAEVTTAVADALCQQEKSK